MAAKRHAPDSKVHGAIMGPIWGRQDPGGPHVGPMNFAIWVVHAVTLNLPERRTHVTTLLQGAIMVLPA